MQTHKTEPLFDWMKGETLKQKGQQRALIHADVNEPGWPERALTYVRRFLQEFPGRRFMTEDVRKWAEKLGLNKPPDGRAWGGVMRKAACEGLIASVGIGKRRDPIAHRAHATVWQGVQHAQT